MYTQLSNKGCVFFVYSNHNGIRTASSWLVVERGRFS
ncbi:hypothetical protein CYPRO_0969 [Cyclonatronum proteinivorum]|uniref:Uncharacterized protein n=1 Tax=Cyclonatronum proteinivorum TaxID=1457365 RepID=A0A345UIE4_9BACT|nr:hypothetical protein CYPRO_0969 [Cyclonatronum proteinivorum]